MAKVKGPALALVFGGGKSSPGRGASESEDDEMDEASEEEGEGEIPADFEDYAVQAFPELEGKPERLKALRKAMMACGS